MGKFLNLFILFYLISACSFDDKSGIWTGTKKISKKESQNLELIFNRNQNNLKTKELTSKKSLKIEEAKTYKNWSQRYQNKFNNLNNLIFSNKGYYEKFSKISNSKVNKNILFSKKNLIFSDQNGNIKVVSLENKELIFSYNFYKKKFKKTKKKIQLILINDLIIAVDNLGYIYCLDFINNKVVWAKNFMIPFRSNLKIIDEILVVSDEKNKIILIDINNGNKINELYTQPSKTVSQFESNLAFDRNNNLLYLSTTGTLYSLNLLRNLSINWIQNFNLDNNLIFDSNPIVVSEDKIIVSTNEKIIVLNDSGRRIWDHSIASNVSPIISGNSIFTLSKENNLIILNKLSGEILFSKNIFLMMESKIAKKYKRKIKKITHLILANKKILLVSENPYFIEFKFDNNLSLSSIKKKPFKISSDIIFNENKMLLIGDKKRIYKIY